MLFVFDEPSHIQSVISRHVGSWVGNDKFIEDYQSIDQWCKTSLSHPATRIPSAKMMIPMIVTMSTSDSDAGEIATDCDTSRVFLAASATSYLNLAISLGVP